jgi:hypothetical protein
MEGMSLRTTPIQDGRHLVELVIGGSVKVSVPCRSDDPADVLRCCHAIKDSVPSIPEDLASRIVEACRPKGIEPISIEELTKQYPNLRDPVIDGILRRGESCNIIAASKVGKSFLAGQLAWCVATGRPWLSYDVTQSKVLIIDNELHPETLVSRLDRMANEMMIDHSDRIGSIDVIPLRGLGLDVNSVGSQLTIPEGQYGLIIVDALYRWLPEGISENSNSDMMQVYNRIDELAAIWGAAVVIVHHASKGDQSEKSLTDVGSGAGAIARAADTHLVIRPHEQPDLNVLEAVTRSFKSPNPVSIKFEYPLWSAIACPAVLKTRKDSGSKSQEKRDVEGTKTIFDAVPQDKEISKRKLRVGMGPQRLTRLLDKLVLDGKLKRRFVKRQGKRTELYSRVGGPVVGLPNGLDQ